MREVSCRALTGYKDYAIRRGVNWTALTSGLRVSPEFLENEREWFDWDDFAEILGRLEEALGTGACHAAGFSGVSTELTGPLRRVAGAMLDLKYMYRFGAMWHAPLLIRHLRSEVETTGDRRLRLRMVVPDHFRANPYFFEAVQGGTEAMPTLFGLPTAQVIASIGPRRGEYDLVLPVQRRGVLGRIRMMLGGPVVDELERQLQAVDDIDRERLRVESALRERDHMLSNLLENLSGLVYRCHAEDLTFEYASPQSEALVGLTAVALVDGNHSLLSLVHADDRERVRKELEACLHEGRACTTEYRLSHRDGHPRWVLDVARGVQEGGRPIAIEGFLTDITARKRLEEELDRVRRAESIGRLAGGVAHDFNNLLTVIVGLVEAVRYELPPEHPAREYNDQIGVAADRAAGLTQQLLAFARRQPIAPKLVNIDALIRSMEKMLRRTLMEDIAFHHTHGDNLWSVRIDPGQFEQVLLNLAINARDAMPGGGALTIETGNVVLEQPVSWKPGLEPGCYVLIRVADSGVGMDSETQRRAFEPFFTTKDTGKGTGLGLASTHGIISQASGYIHVKTAPGEGTAFSIYLPRAAGEATTSLAPRPPTRTGGSERILLVEDHDVLRALFSNALEERGYAVLPAGSVREALDLLRDGATTIDLLVTDVVMPGVPGPELAETLRARTPNLPVIFMSGYSERGRLNAEQSNTATSFLPKPLTPATLASEVRVLLDRG